jgi:hypothetical protein
VCICVHTWWNLCAYTSYDHIYAYIYMWLYIYIIYLYIYIYDLFIYTVWYMLYIYTYTYIYIHMCVWSEVLTWWLLNRQWCYVRVSHPDIVWWSWARLVLEVHGSLQGFTTRIETYGYGSKPCTPGEHQNSW